MQVLTARCLAVTAGVADKPGTDALASCRDRDHGVLQPGMDKAIPQDADEADQAGAVPGDHPAEAVPVHEPGPVPLCFAGHPGAEGFRVQDVDFLVGEVAQPLADHDHEAKLARGEVSNGAVLMSPGLILAV